MYPIDSPNFELNDFGILSAEISFLRLIRYREKSPIQMMVTILTIWNVMSFLIIYVEIMQNESSNEGEIAEVYENYQAARDR